MSQPGNSSGWGGVARVNFSYAFVSLIHKNGRPHSGLETTCCLGQSRLKREGFFTNTRAELDCGGVMVN